jgi:hypothetical protein
MIGMQMRDEGNTQLCRIERPGSLGVRRARLPYDTDANIYEICLASSYDRQAWALPAGSWPRGPSAQKHHVWCPIRIGSFFSRILSPRLAG